MNLLSEISNTQRRYQLQKSFFGSAARLGINGVIHFFFRGVSL